MAPAAPLSFTAGWVRLTFATCRGQGGGRAAYLEVVADRRLTFSSGRRGGVTLGLLSGSARASGAAPQRFALPAASVAARELALAPWAAGTAPARVASLRLTSHPAPASEPRPGR